MKTQGIIVEGTTCESCATIIKKQALRVNGVKAIEFDYATERGEVIFDEKKTNIDEILYKIEEKGYTGYLLDESASPNSGMKKTIGWVAAVLGLLVAGYFLLSFVEGIQVPELSQNMGYGLLFIVGLLTGFHCVAMCGGFVVSYTAKAAKEGKSTHLSHAAYGFGKTVSYVIIGALFGLLGSFIAFTPMLRGVVGILAGLFLVLFGFKMLNIIPWLRRFSLRTPRFIAQWVGEKNTKHSSPLVIGLLNGLMLACGPLQAMYIMAAGTGSMFEGAKLMLIFGLGTLPAMLGFGYLASVVSNKATTKILKASGVVVIVLGVIMLNRGLALTGSGYDGSSLIASVSAASGNGITGDAVTLTPDGYQEIRMDVLASGWNPDTFTLQKNVPVRWIIDGKEITGCNNAIQVPAYGLEFDIRPGEQVIEFTPTETGTVSWSCWMGMIPGTFIVTDDGTAAPEQVAAATPKTTGSCGGGGSCGGSCGGGCGCGS